MTTRWFGVVGFALACASHALAQCPQWTASFAGSGPNEPVRALVEHDDGSGNALYVAGVFSLAAATPANHIARWNGSVWSPLGAGTDNDIDALCVSSVDGAPALYAGGIFTAAGGAIASRIARWNGLAWNALGAGVSAEVLCMVEFDDGGGPALYAGGRFLSAGGSPASHVARWRNGAWSALGGGLADRVEALAVHDDGSGAGLYAAGPFAGGVAVWNGSTWTTVGSGLTGTFSALASFVPTGSPAQLYVGREYPVSSQALYRWSGTTWTNVAQVTGRVLALSVIDDQLGRALWIARDGGTTRFDGTLWTSAAAYQFVQALSGYDDGALRRVCAGGRFLALDQTKCDYVAGWDGNGWEAVGESPHGIAGDATVYDLEEWTPPGATQPQTFVAGSFGDLGNVEASGIATWNGHAWASVGQLYYASVNDLVPIADPALGGPALVGVGEFDGPGMSTFVARWDGSNWAAIPGADTFWFPEHAAVFRASGATSDTLVISGYFNQPFVYTAAWNGSVWTNLGGGISAKPNALAAYDPPGPQPQALYVASAAGVTRWDGAGWSFVIGGSTPSLPVLSLCVWDDGSGAGPSLYAASQSGANQPSVCRWDGVTWTNINPPNAPSTQPVLTSFDDGNGDALYLGTRLRWRAGQWTTFNNEIPNDTVEVMRGFAPGSAFGRALVIGGSFANVGSVSSARIARWSDPCATLVSYCTAKTNSQGCTPAFGWSGEPSIALSATTPFTITASNVINQKGGLLYFGASGRSAVPFQGGFKCVRFPALRTPPRSSGGNLGPDDCSGVYAIDFTPWITGANNELLDIGVTVDAQWWSRDPASASTTGLTDAIEFEIRP